MHENETVMPEITADSMFGEIRDIRMKWGRYKISVTHNTVRKPSTCFIRITARDVFSPDISYADGKFIISYPWPPVIPQENMADFKAAWEEAEKFCEVMSPILDEIRKNVEAYKSEILPNK